MSITPERKSALISEHARGNADTGSPEVQVAILSERIANLTEHFKTHKKAVTTLLFSLIQGFIYTFKHGFKINIIA